MRLSASVIIIPSKADSKTWALSSSFLSTCFLCVISKAKISIYSFWDMVSITSIKILKPIFNSISFPAGDSLYLSSNSKNCGGTFFPISLCQYVRIIQLSLFAFEIVPSVEILKRGMEFLPILLQCIDWD